MSPQKIIGLLLVGYLGVVSYVSFNKKPVDDVKPPVIEHTLEIDKTKPESQVNPNPVDLLPIKPLEEVPEVVVETPPEPTTPVSIIKKFFKKKEEAKKDVEPKPKPKVVAKPLPSYVPPKTVKIVKRKCDTDYARINDPSCKWVRDVFEEHGTWKKLHNEKYGPE